MLVWVNSVNDESKDGAALVDSRLCDARRAIHWGTLFMVLGLLRHPVGWRTRGQFRHEFAHMDHDAARGHPVRGVRDIHCPATTPMRI